MTPSERYDESDQATEDFAGWLLEQAAVNSDHRMFDTARATWETSDDFSDCCDDWYRQRELERRRMSEGAW